MKSVLEQNYNILLLDDSPEDREICKRHLSTMSGVKFDIEEAENIDTALNKLNDNNAYDCFIIDYNLPDGNGLDFVKAILEGGYIDGTNSPAIIVMSGQGNEEIAAESFKRGAHEYITKKSISDGFLGKPVLNAIERAQLSAQLSSFRSKLEMSNKKLSEFAHTAAHDLKSPLRRISAYCEILLDDAAKDMSDENAQILHRMAVNTNRLQELVDSLLTYSLIEHEEEEKEDVDIHQLLKDIIKELGGDVLPANVELMNLPTVSVYPERIEQLFQNLLSNAVKYKSDAPLKLKIKAEKQNTHILFSVKDNGMGISERDKQEVFKEFKRLHSSEDIEGSGLGLSICQKIVTLHGGRIWVDSKPDEGSTFYFTIHA